MPDSPRSRTGESVAAAASTMARTRVQAALSPNGVFVSATAPRR